MDNAYSAIHSSTLASNQDKWGVVCIRVEICTYLLEAKIHHQNELLTRVIFTYTQLKTALSG